MDYGNADKQARGDETLQDARPKGEKILKAKGVEKQVNDDEALQDDIKLKKAKILKEKVDFNRVKRINGDESLEDDSRSKRAKVLKAKVALKRGNANGDGVEFQKESCGGISRKTAKCQ